MSIGSVFSSIHEQTIVETGEHCDEIVDDVRSRNLTDKGMSYQISLHEGKFRSHVSQWRRECSTILVVISDKQDVQCIREHRQFCKIILII